MLGIMTDKHVPAEGITERRFKVQGKQAVTINGKYGYVWGRGDTDPLLKGDRVVLPGEEWIGTVTDLGSMYSGYHASIVERAEG
jgi:hypothetical protein